MTRNVTLENQLIPVGAVPMVGSTAPRIALGVGGRGTGRPDQKGVAMPLPNREELAKSFLDGPQRYFEARVMDLTADIDNLLVGEDAKLFPSKVRCES
jgi:hypothetical protein